MLRKKTKILSIKNIAKSFGGVKAIDTCSLDVDENNIVALIGPNGAGKTTLFDIISGFVRPDAGDIHYKGKLIVGAAPHAIAQHGLIRTFQLTRLFPNLTVMENMLLAQKQDGEKFWNALLKSNKHEQKANEGHVLGFLRLVGLESKKHEPAASLSYGQQKLLEIARSLAARPELLLLDEPAAGVTPALRIKLKEIIRELKKRGKTIFFIEHDMPFVMDLADYIVVLDHGKEITVGTPKEIKENPKVLDAYLGRCL